jgi:hypothetical protein
MEGDNRGLDRRLSEDVSLNEKEWLENRSNQVFELLKDKDKVEKTKFLLIWQFL